MKEQVHEFTTLLALISIMFLFWGFSMLSVHVIIGSFVSFSIFVTISIFTTDEDYNCKSKDGL